MSRSHLEILDDLLEQRSSVTEEEIRQLPTADKQELADHVFLQTLLEEHFHTDLPRREQRIQRVVREMRAIPSDPMSPPSPVTLAIDELPSQDGALPLRFRWILPALIALMVLLVAALLMQDQTPIVKAEVSPRKAVEAALTASLKPVDQRFLMRVLSVDAVVPLQATLFARGNCYVLQQPALFPGATLTVGTDGEQSWIVPAIGPILIQHNRGFLPPILQEPEGGTLYLQVHTAIEQMSLHYDLSELEPLILPDLEQPDQTVSCHRVLGLLRTPSDWLPSRMELCAEQQSGATREIHLFWDNPKPVSDLTEIHFELIDRPTLPDNWYQHSAHHGPNRPVIERTTSTN